MSVIDWTINKISGLWNEFVDRIERLIDKVVDSIRGWIKRLIDRLRPRDFIETTGTKTVRKSQQDFAAEFRKVLKQKNLVATEMTPENELDLYRTALARTPTSDQHAVPLDESERQQWKATTGETKKIIQVHEE